MDPHKAQWFILVIVNIPVYLGLGRLIFKDWDGLMETLRLWSNTDWLMTIQKEWREDRWETSKLPVFLLLCVLLVVGEYMMFAKSTIKPATHMLGV